MVESEDDVFLEKGEFWWWVFLEERETGGEAWNDKSTGE